jgi:hypothetical protein
MTKVRPTWDEVAVVVALLIPAAGYVFGGLTLGVVLLFLAIALMIALWTPVRGWLGIPPHASRGGVSAAHRSDLQTIAEAFNDRLARERTTVYVSEQRPLYAQAFRAHFPDVAQRGELAEHPGPQRGFGDHVDQRDPREALARAVLWEEHRDHRCRRRRARPQRGRPALHRPPALHDRRCPRWRSKEGRETWRGEGCCATTPIGADTDHTCHDDCCT